VYYENNVLGLDNIIEIIKTHENVDVDMLNIEKERVYEIIGVNTIQQLVALEEMMDMKEMMIVKNKID
jgi:hypothetical protein